MLRWTALGLAVLILGTAAAGYLYYQHLNGNLKKDDLNLGTNRLDRSAPNAEGQRPMNILVLGSDSRNTRENVRLGGAHDQVGRKPLADVQMLVHVSADRSNMSVVSVPRDTRVTIPQCTDTDDGHVYPKTEQIINSSLGNGGPGCTVATWEELTGIPIDHFMMIDFSGVVRMADAVGGVPVCVNANVRDRDSGLRLEKGRTVVKGKTALSWLRTRHGFAGGSDIARAKAQHMYMSAMVRQLKAGTKLTDPGKLMGLAEAATKSLTVDKGIGTVKKLYDLGNDLKSVPADRITMATMPWLPDPRNPTAHVIPKPGDADKLFSLVRNDIALDGKDKKKPSAAASQSPGSSGSPGSSASASPSGSPAPPSAPRSQIPVTVLNGTRTSTLAAVPGRAGLIASTLVRDGFTQAVAGTAPRSRTETVISYAAAGQRGDALAVAKALGLPDSAVRVSSSVTRVTLVIGADWRYGSTYPKASGGGTGTGGTGAGGHASAGPGDGRTPESADALNGDDTSACMDVDPLHMF
ncbi:LCP family protein [Streptomyces sp. B1866]|uniref:LCP family protein n=1 Tax=Streptomyces sp. B1866 TaxID=3075431 RepID=UPI002891A219|nr:LCP family protein [Streptomyces sp. B1866]MDT3400595.1 LCP family protein [Streptomyces sp. B1866]